MRANENLLINEIFIEEMSEADIAAVQKLEVDGKLSAWSAEGYRSELNNPDSICLVAKLDNKIVGFIIARLIMSDYCCEIYNIGVDFKYRRNKIGSELLLILRNYCIASNLHKIQLEVRQSNGTAIEFYQKQGYRISYTRKNFYNNPPENAFVMLNELK